MPSAGHELKLTWVPPSPVEIKQLRKKLGMTQLVFARTFRLNIGTLKAWEQGRNEPECFNALVLLMLIRDTETILRLIAAVVRDEK